MDESDEEALVAGGTNGKELVLEIENCALELELLRLQLEQQEPSSDSSGRSSPDAEHQSVHALAAECLGLLESLEKQSAQDLDYSEDDEDATESQDLDQRFDLEQRLETPDQSPSARNAELLADMNSLADELTALTTMITAFDDAPDVGLEEQVEDEVSIDPGPTSSEDTTHAVSKEPSDTRVNNATAPTKRAHSRSSIYRHAFFLACSSKRKQRLRVRESAKEATRRALESPKLWKEHQNKSFQHHIARQKLARQQQEQEKAQMEAMQAARFERASSLRDCVPAKPSSKLPKCLYNSYMGRFRQDRPVNLEEHKQKLQEAQAKAHALEAQDGCLCGVYLHGKRRKDMVYITSTSLQQLKERLCARLPGTKVLNVYKERVAVVAHNSSLDEAQNAFYLERVTRFSQIKDGDRLCVTQNAYEDMAILCDWMKRRQRVMYRMEHRPVARPCSPAKSASSSSKKSPVFGGYSALFAESKKPQVWDQNGRTMSVKEQFPI